MKLAFVLLLTGVAVVSSVRLPPVRLSSKNKTVYVDMRSMRDGSEVMSSGESRSAKTESRYTEIPLVAQKLKKLSMSPITPNRGINEMYGTELSRNKYLSTVLDKVRNLEKSRNLDVSRNDRNSKRLDILDGSRAESERLYKTNYITNREESKFRNSILDSDEREWVYRHDVDDIYHSKESKSDNDGKQYDYDRLRELSAKQQDSRNYRNRVRGKRNTRDNSYRNRYYKDRSNHQNNYRYRYQNEPVSKNIIRNDEYRRPKILPYPYVSRQDYKQSDDVEDITKNLILNPYRYDSLQIHNEDRDTDQNSRNSYRNNYPGKRLELDRYNFNDYEKVSGNLNRSPYKYDYLKESGNVGKSDRKASKKPNRQAYLGKRGQVNNIQRHDIGNVYKYMAPTRYNELKDSENDISKKYKSKLNNSYRNYRLDSRIDTRNFSPSRNEGRNVFRSLNVDGRTRTHTDLKDYGERIEMYNKYLNERNELGSYSIESDERDDLRRNYAQIENISRNNYGEYKPSENRLGDVLRNVPYITNQKENASKNPYIGLNSQSSFREALRNIPTDEDLFRNVDVEA